MSSDDRGRGRWRRRAGWAAGLLLGGIVLLAAVAQAVLWSDLPRRTLARAASEMTGLRVRLDSVTIAWGGTTALHGVQVGLPLRSPPFARAAVVRLRHHPLPVVIATRSLGLRRVEIDGLRVRAVERDEGWNVVRAGAILRSMAGSGAGEAGIDVPEVVLRDALVTVARADGRRAAFRARAEALADAGRVLRVDASLGGISVTGRVAPGSWLHEFAFDAPDGTVPAGLWLTDPPAPLAVRGDWRGDRLSGRWHGTLTVSAARAGAFEASGSAGLELGNDGLLVRLGTIQLTHPSAPEGSVRVRDGSIVAGPGGARIEGVGVAYSAVTGLVRGTYDHSQRGLEGSVEWRSDASGPGGASTGTATVRVAVPASGVCRVDARISGAGERGWRAVVRGTGEGPSPDRLSGGIEVPVLRVRRGERSIDASGLACAWRVAWPRVELDLEALPGAPGARGSAWFEAVERTWSVRLDTGAWLVPGVPGTPAAVVLAARGTAAARGTVDLRASAEGADLVLTGSLDRERDPPLRAHAEFGAALPDAGADGASAGRATASVVVQIEGTVSPPGAVGEGTVRTTAWAVGRGVLEPMTIDLDARLRAGALEVTASAPELLDGRLLVTLRRPLDEGTTEAHVRIAGVTIDRVTGLAVPGARVGGVLAVDATARIPGLAIGEAEVAGSWTIDGAGRGAWSVDRGSGRVEYRAGRVRVHEMALERGHAVLGGEASFDAAEGLIRLELGARDWAVGLEGSELVALISGEAAVAVDPRRASASGPVRVRARTMVGAAEFGDIEVSGRLDERTVVVDALRAAVLGGLVRGAARVPVDDWTRLEAAFELERLDLAMLAQAGASGVRGTLSGRVDAAPATGRRVVEPLAVEADLRLDDGMYRRMALGDARLVAHLGRDRLVLEAPAVPIAGGTIGVWSRLSWHDDEPFVHVSANGKGLRIDQLVPPTLPGTPGPPGLVEGELAFGGYVFEPRRAYGDGELRLTESDIGTVPVLSQLYGLLALDAPGDPPEGRGVARLRLEGDTLLVTDLRYLNRGAVVLASGGAANIWLGGASPVAGSAAAAVAPAGSGGLPLADTLNRMFVAATQGTVSVRVTGTLGEPRIDVVPLAEVREMVERLLGRPDAGP